MIELLFNQANVWFSVSLTIVVFLFLLELAAMFFGASLLGLDGDVALDTDTSVLAIGNWFNLNQVPFMVWLTSFLTSFGFIGLGINGLSNSLFSVSLPIWVSVSVALVLGLIVTRKLSVFIGSLIPKIETSALQADSFSGTVATLTLGSAQPGNPAEAKFTDSHDQVHYVMVEPIESNESFQQGDQVVLVKKDERSWLATRY